MLFRFSAPPGPLRLKAAAAGAAETEDRAACGAVTAALSGSVDGFIKYITDDIMLAIGSERDPYKATCLNVEHAVDRLKKEFADHPEVGGAVIEGAVYDIRTGEVKWL